MEKIKALFVPSQFSKLRSETRKAREKLKKETEQRWGDPLKTAQFRLCLVALAHFCIFVFFFSVALINSNSSLGGGGEGGRSSSSSSSANDYYIFDYTSDEVLKQHPNIEKVFSRKFDKAGNLSFGTFEFRTTSVLRKPISLYYVLEDFNQNHLLFRKSHRADLDMDPFAAVAVAKDIIQSSQSGGGNFHDDDFFRKNNNNNNNVLWNHCRRRLFDLEKNPAKNVEPGNVIVTTNYSSSNTSSRSSNTNNSTEEAREKGGPYSTPRVLFPCGMTPATVFNDTFVVEIYNGETTTKFNNELLKNKSGSSDITTRNNNSQQSESAIIDSSCSSGDKNTTTTMGMWRRLHNDHSLESVSWHRKTMQKNRNLPFGGGRNRNSSSVDGPHESVVAHEWMHSWLAEYFPPERCEPENYSISSTTSSSTEEELEEDYDKNKVSTRWRPTHVSWRYTSTGPAGTPNKGPRELDCDPIKIDGKKQSYSSGNKNTSNSIDEDMIGKKNILVKGKNNTDDELVEYLTSTEDDEAYRCRFSFERNSFNGVFCRDLVVNNSSSITSTTSNCSSTSRKNASPQNGLNSSTSTTTNSSSSTLASSTTTTGTQRIAYVPRSQGSQWGVRAARYVNFMRTAAFGDFQKLDAILETGSYRYICIVKFRKHPSYFQQS